MVNGGKQPIRVLLIEDSDVDAMFVRRLLESNPELPLKIDQATRLEEAIQFLRSADYDVAMLDLSLPDADGLESFDQIRALDARLPVVVFTGSEDEDLALTAIESGAQDFMAKGHVTGQMLFRSLRFAIARQRKVMGFQAAADTDPLTGMPNRRHLESRFAELLSQSKQQQVPMSLGLIDVDHFKSVNDQHGHFIGDAVLKEVARILSEGLPEGMLAARFGGEEFALLLPGLAMDPACGVVENLLAVLAEKTMLFGELSVRVTASAGVVEIEHDETWDESFVRADVALYEAKKSGRNRLCRHHKGRVESKPTGN